MNNVKRPRIRFPEFTDDWEQRKLNKLAEYNSSPLTVNDIDDKGDYDLYDANILIGKTNKSPLADDYISIIKDGAGVGRVRKLPKNTCVLGTMGAITPHNCDYNFLFLLLEKTDFTKLTSGGTIPHIYFKQYGESVYSVPLLAEQIKIGKYFSNLDNLITLHLRKLDMIKKYKEGLLQKMFPKIGETVPEIRFRGFTNPWKHHKMGELYTERNERGNDGLKILSVSIHTGVSDGALDEKSLGKYVKRSKDKSIYKHVYTGDLVFNMMRAWQGAIGVAKNEGMISPAYISAIPNNEVYPLFMDYALRRKSVISDINNLSYGVTDFRKRLYWDSFVKVSCIIPSIDEQKKIYNYLKSIDNLIAFHQRKLEKMKKMKNGLLQQMFV